MTLVCLEAKDALTRAKFPLMGLILRSFLGARWGQRGLKRLFSCVRPIDELDENQ
ncbi:unknown protein [Microcystis aeruginosa NIES-843]|uniref:Uncharacterized protein n=1 Tax=Microcystis aeruginosa (strain NIES-843 / IAM M-2473) TaxID=449447 RepID=B0JIM8_MICAN|nr:unknown protein [Microcystis aeruginosa NIES-843]